VALTSQAQIAVIHQAIAQAHNTFQILAKDHHIHDNHSVIFQERISVNHFLNHAIESFTVLNLA